MKIGLIGNPANRRVTLNREAVSEAGLQCQIYAWHDFPAWLGDIASCDLIKIESAGEDDHVQMQQIALGDGPVSSDKPIIEYGELAFLSQAYRGFCRQLEALEMNGLHFFNPPADIKTMFDKWACHKRFDLAGVPRPRSFLAPSNVDEFFESVNQTESGRLFLKPLHGSSASGVLAFRWQGKKQQIITPLEIHRSADGVVRFFNSLRIRSYLELGDIKEILRHLLPHGMIAEQWLRKVHYKNKNVDARLVVIGGEACHFIARKNRHPMTNLHLGSERVTEVQFASAFGQSAVNVCRDAAEQAAACFPDSLYCGVDILLTPDLNPVVLEVNAFGDLLPNVMYKGKSTYTAIMQSAIKNACNFI